MQTMYQLESAMFQGLKSHKLDFADKLVRLNERLNLSHHEKEPPSEPSTYHITSSLPKTWHALMTIVLMNKTVNNRNKTSNIIKGINIIVLYMYAHTRFSCSYDEVGFRIIDLHL